MNEQNPMAVFLSAFGVSSFAGLAALIRNGKRPTRMDIFSAMLNSGLIGLALAMLWFHKFQDNIYFLIGITILAGLGGATMVDFVLTLFRAYLGAAANVKIEEKPKAEEKKNGNG